VWQKERELRNPEVVHILAAAAAEVVHNLESVEVVHILEAGCVGRERWRWVVHILEVVVHILVAEDFRHSQALAERNQLGYRLEWERQRSLKVSL